MEVMASAGTIPNSVLSPCCQHTSSFRRSQVASGRKLAFNSTSLRHQNHHEGLRKSSSAVDVLRPLSMCEGFDLAVNSHLASSETSSRHASCGVVSAVFERFTERAIKSVMLAQREAKSLGKREVGTEQLLLGLIAEERGKEGYLGSGVTLERAREAVRSLLDESVGSGMLGPATDVPFSHGSKRVFEAALEHSKKMGHNYIAPEHIAIALLAVDDGGASRVLDRLGVKKGKLQSEAVAKLQGELEKEGRAASSSVAMPQKAAAGGSAAKRSSTRREKGALNDFCVDITAQAAEGKIDPVIGRDKEVERVVQILARRTKNNPILLGEPGVGKTAIAEGLAMRISGGDVPEFLIGKRVMSLDMGLLLAGAKERGELETRVTSLIEETRSAGNVILLIDEVHTLVGSGSVGRGGSAGSGLDIANLLKPALARGELQCIGATTLDEHRKHIEKDKALARRFQPVMVLEPSQEEAVMILMGLRSRYEEHHKCHITREAVEAAVSLSARYIADRFLPDKAIDLLDEAGSRARINSFRRRKERQTSILTRSPHEYWQEILAVQASQEAALVTAAGNTDSILNDLLTSSSIAPRGIDADKDVSSVDADIRSDEEEFAEGPVVVGPAEIAAVAAMWSGIPVEQLTNDEQVKLMDLEKLLRTRVIGQDEAVNAISRAVRRARVGLKDPNRPIAAMLFCGPTGVGKTELTKALAQHYFGSEEAMIRLDMSEYMERHTVSKLIGSPPGYIGYGEGGALTEAVRRRPFTVILMDEIEKAHPDVFNILLQIFEDGHLTDSQGRQVSFKNVLIVMTSNVGSTAIAKGGSSRIGFNLSDEADGGKYSQLKTLVMDELKGYFRPELLNRLDEVVVFRALEKSQVRAIVDIMLEETKGRLAARGLHLEVSEAMVKLICDQGYDRSYGARPLRRAVMSLVEDNLSEALLLGEFNDGDTALLDVDETGNPKVFRHERPDPCKHGLCLPVLKTVTVSSPSD